MNIITLDIGGTFIKAAMMNENAQILEQWKVPSPTTSLEDMLAALDSCIAPHLENADGIAISMPGRIDTEKGIAHTGGAFTFIRNLEIKKILEDKYNKPVAVDNDGKCAANAENWIGALKDAASGLVYVIGTGIGGGLVIDHKVYRGFTYAACELSCALIDKTGKADGENYIVQKISTATMLKGYSEQSPTKEKIDGIEFFKRVHAGETLANEVFNEFARMTANYFFELQIILDVETIAIGGGISAQPILLKKIQNEVDKIWDIDYPLPCSKPKLVLCQYGNDANLIGALKNWFEHQ